jgi:hypothetical protein
VRKVEIGEWRMGISSMVSITVDSIKNNSGIER